MAVAKERFFRVVHWFPVVRRVWFASVGLGEAREEEGEGGEMMVRSFMKDFSQRMK